MCGLRTRPRTDLNPRRVELPSVGAYRLAASGAIACLIHPVYSAEIVFRNQFVFKRSIDRSKREFTPRKTVQTPRDMTSLEVSVLLVSLFDSVGRLLRVYNNSAG